ncbi:MAG TPA: hypothetical protein VL360_04545 [Gammaproteobacteria bacterium]|jgi:hypothetical protein|nr:hypothetical protein [Gammaproteobacteria bacterium]
MKKRTLAVIIALISMNTHAAVTQGIQGRSRGDVIAVKTDSQIMAWCDFNKQIVTTQFNTLCAYNGNQQSISD